MKYFITAEERKKQGGTCYVSFPKYDGTGPGGFWSDNYLYLHMDYFFELPIGTVFKMAGIRFALCGLTDIRKEQWPQVLEAAKEIGGECQEIFEELAPWMERYFEEADFCTICGL